MHYIVYKTTNLLDGKFYIGTHRTPNLNDGYMGSGKYLKRAIDKHGPQNFRRDILFVFDNADDMFAKEAELVTEELLTNENTYNLKVGGFGGWDHINRSNDPQRVLKNRRARETTNRILKEKYGDDWNTFISSKAGKANFERHGVNPNWVKAGRTSFLGKTHTDGTKEKMRQYKLDKVSGIDNPQYGKMWVTNGVKEYSIPKNDPIPEGCRKGRLPSSKFGTVKGRESSGMPSQEPLTAESIFS